MSGSASTRPTGVLSVCRQPRTIELRYRVTPGAARALVGPAAADALGPDRCLVVRLDVDGRAVRVELRGGDGVVALKPRALGLADVLAPARVERADGLVHVDWPGVGRVTLRGSRAIYAQLGLIERLGGGRFEQLDAD